VKAIDKIVSLEALPAWREAQRAAGRKVVVTNGCFDILHAGHVTYLEAAQQQGDLLLVGLNSDESVRQLKGPARPVNCEQDRALVLASMQSVDAVCIFRQASANNFLKIAQPDIYVKGGDYTVETIPQDERRTVESLGGKIVFAPVVPGKSTTSIVKKMSGS